MLKKCLVGRLKTEASSTSFGVKANKPRPPPLAPFSTSSVNGFIAPRLPKPTAISFAEVTTDWMQSSQSVSVVLYTRQKGLDAKRISTAFDQGTAHLRMRVYADDRRFFDYSVTLASPVDAESNANFGLTVSPSTGKVELSLRKKMADVHWKTIGQIHQGDKNGSFRPLSLAPPFFRPGILQRRQSVTHNVDLLTVAFPVGHFFHVPIGWHVQLKIKLQGDPFSIPSIFCASSISSFFLSFHFLFFLFRWKRIKSQLHTRHSQLIEGGRWRWRVDRSFPVSVGERRNLLPYKNVPARSVHVAIEATGGRQRH